MNARIDALTARQVVRDAAVRRADAAQGSLRSAVKNQKAAAAGIDRAIAAAESAIESTSRERDALLEQLASAQGVTVQVAAKKQDEIDERIDQGGPSTPVGGPATDPTTSPEPTDPTPSGPKPTEPKPKPTVAPQPKPTPKPADPPPASGGKAERAIAYAQAQLGEPYKWGGAGPGSWDCSGLVMKAWGSAGVSLPHSAGAQYSRTQKVSLGSIQRGDLVYWGKSPGSIYHVAMYLGGGKMIHAPRPGRNVEIVPITYWIKPSFASRPG
jgi:cell wall-associated NlpC family hydrolase